jgi:hypothetical protein
MSHSVQPRITSRVLGTPRRKNMAYLVLAFLYFMWAVARTAFIALLVRASIACGWHIAEVAFHFIVACTYTAIYLHS